MKSFISEKSKLVINPELLFSNLAISLLNSLHPIGIPQDKHSLILVGIDALTEKFLLR